MTGEVRARGAVNGNGSVYLINHNADNALVTLRYRLKDATVEPLKSRFDAAGRKFNRGSFIISRVALPELRQAAADLGLQVYATATAPTVKTHPLRAPRIALMHTWMSTQDEGWWRLALDQMGVPYSYISTQDVAKDDDLREKYDVIIFAPVGAGNESIINGMPMWGNPIPWKTTRLTPNIGKIDSTDDMRPGLGYSGLMNLQKFTQRGRVVYRSDGYSRTGSVYRVHTGTFNRTPAATEGDWRGLAIKDCRCGKPGRIWLWRHASHLHVSMDQFLI